jgi:hypothetical protein
MQIENVYILWHMVDLGHIDLSNVIIGVYQTRKSAEEEGEKANEYTWITEHELWY